MAAILLFQLYLLIFSFSEQDAETSGSLSYMISQKCVEFMNALTGGSWTESFQEGLAAYFENPIRKLAHFAEYACMGVLIYGIWRPWKQGNGKWYLLTILWVLVSAAGDEIHQLYVPGRSGNLPDVLLDTCGGSFGLLCGICLERISLWRRKRKERKNKKNKVKI